MTATQTLTGQITCEYGTCPNTHITRNGGIEKVRKEARDSFNWVVIEDRDICGDHAAAETRRIAKEKVKRGY